jgi:hypothetical protein
MSSPQHNSAITVFMMQLVESKPLMLASLSGIGGYALLGDNAQSALQFGAVAALGGSLGDTVLSALGYASKINTYFPDEMSYVDPADALGAAVGTGVVAYSLGSGGNDLMKMMGIAAVAGAFAPKLAGYFANMTGYVGKFQGGGIGPTVHGRGNSPDFRMPPVDAMSVAP